MNKKYLSVILFGALMLGTTGTFTSCKDYDDDINNLQTQITANADAIKKLQDLVGEGKWVTSVVGIENGIKVTMNDGTTADILGINGEDGKDGKDGTVVTIIDGFWAFDGVKSEYPAVPGSASEAHEIKISEDGYWMIWDTEKGEYVTTTYAVAPVSAAQNSNGSWTITIKNADGTTSSINIPATALASIELDQASKKDMTYWYGVLNEDVKWGWNKEETMDAGFYSKLNQNLLVLLNPAGVHGDSYAYTLKNSNGDEAPVTFFKTAVPYTGAALTKTTSSNGLWVLPAEITKKPAADIETLRRELYLSFKENDGAAYRLALQAADEQGNTVRTEYDNTVTLGAATAKTGKQTVDFEENCLIGETYYPEFVGDYAGQIYKYKMRLTQTAQNLRYAEVFGATVTADGQGYLATKEAGIFNEISYDICGIYINGETFTATIKVRFTNEMTTDRSWTIDAISKKPLDADKVDLSKFTNTYIKDQLKNSANLFAYAYTFDLTEKVAELSDTEKLVWDQAIANIKSLRDDKELYINGLIGGEGENNSENVNELLNKHMSWSINARNASKNPNVLTVTFYVSPDWDTTESVENANFKLNNAYQLTLYVVDPENPAMNVAEIVLPFEFTMPTLDITPDTGNFTQWTTDANGEEYLMAYGAYDDKSMWLPLYEAFKAWTKEYTEYDANAEYYKLYKTTNTGYLMGDYTANKKHALDSDLKYTTVWQDWGTYTGAANAATNDDEEMVMTVYTEYNHYGVYPETLFTGGKTDNKFELVFASLLKNSTVEMAEGSETLVAKAGTNDVFISDDILNLTTPMKQKFYLFDGLNGGTKVERVELNKQSFNEEQRPFITVADLFAVSSGSESAVVTAKDKNGTEEHTVLVGTWDKKMWVIDPVSGERSYNLGDPDASAIKIFNVPAFPAVQDPTHKWTAANVVEGHTGGMAIQLPKSIADKEEIEFTITLSDKLGFTKALKFTVTKLQ